jgi:protein SCO1/2
MGRNETLPGKPGDKWNEVGQPPRDTESPLPQAMSQIAGARSVNLRQSAFPLPLGRMFAAAPGVAGVARGRSRQWRVMALCLAAARLGAQVPPPPIAPPSVLERIGLDQMLGSQLPLELRFRDEDGGELELRECFGEKPVVLALVYYRCPTLCPMVLGGMLAAFKTIRLGIGADFNVVTVSIDPREGAEAARASKERHLRQYGRPGATRGWRFLTGDEEAIETLAAACGFRYYHDARSDQYAHPGGILVATPEGKLSRYLYGLEYSPRDLQLSLVEASGNRIGSLVDQVLLLCYQYDPATGKYGLVIMTSLRLGGVLVLLGLGGFIVLALRKERRTAAEARRGPP